VAIDATGQSPARSLRLLIAEDSEWDVELVHAELQRAGYDVHHQRVQTAGDFVRALSQATWDLVISDHSMPGFSALAALEILQQQRLDLPFIVVCGEEGQDTAVAAMKAGAHDYIMKEDLARLVPAVRRELREAEERRRLVSLAAHTTLMLTGERAELTQRARLLGATDVWGLIPAPTLRAWERVFAWSVGPLREIVRQGELEAAYQEGRRLSIGDATDLALTLLEDFSATLVSAESESYHPLDSLLSKREQEVIRLVAEGLSNKAIGKRLSISPSTVTYHLTNVFNKLNVSSRAQAVAVSMRLSRWWSKPPFE